MDYELPDLGQVNLEKDVCEYSIHLQTPSHSRAKEVQTIARAIAAPWLKDYIWQEEPFGLQLSPDHRLLGRTRFGDCIEDEWFIVWILYEVSRQCPDVYISVQDTDGEFLLIESAMHLPRWLDPETGTHRAWLTRGQFILIEPSPEQTKQRQCPALSLAQALQHLRSNGPVLHSPVIQQDALSRISTYPEQSRKERHRIRCLLPRKIVTLLHRDKRQIAPACIEFYNHNAMQDSNRFGNSRATLLTASESQDLVSVAVQCTRTLYAQIKGSRLTIPAWWNPTNLSTGIPASDTAASQTGLKITLGFILLHEADQSLLFPDPATLATDEEMQGWDQTVDSDDYLHVNFEELEAAMRSMQDETKMADEMEARPTREDDLGDGGLKKMVEQVQKFMHSESTFEGAEFSDDDDNEGKDFEEDDDDDEEELDTDEEESYSGFMDFLRSPVSGPGAMQVLARPSRALTDSASEDEGKEEVGDARKEPRAEEEDSETESVGDLKSYMESMDRELSGHGISALPPGKISMHKTTDKRPNLGDEDDDDSRKEVEEEEELEDDLKIDFELAKNMLESMKGGGAGGSIGPATGLFSRLGISIPRDDSDW